MLRTHLFVIVMFVAVHTPVHADLISPEVGWRAELNTLFHDVAGMVTIVDDDTVRVDDFVYDGGGPSVFFYLGTSNTDPAFESGLRIGSQLDVTSFDGTQAPMMIDLPAGETLEGYHAISVWCARFDVNFGSGTFAPVPEPTTLSLIALGSFFISIGRRWS